MINRLRVWLLAMDSWVTTWIGDCLWAAKASRYVTGHLGQLSLPSLYGRWIKYQVVWLGCVHLCRVEGNTVWSDHIWPVMSCCSEMTCSGELYHCTFNLVLKAENFCPLNSYKEGLQFSVDCRIVSRAKEFARFCRSRICAFSQNSVLVGDNAANTAYFCQV